MLESLRLFANSWPAKIFLGLIILSFAFIWALPVYTNIGTAEVLSSGQTSVSRGEFIYRINKALTNAGMALNQNRPISVAQANKIGLLPNIMQQLNFGTLINEDARLMKLGMSENTIAKLLANDDFFKTGNSFSKAHFISYVNNLGLLQKDIINAYKKDAQNTQLIRAMTDGQSLPKAFTDIANKYQQQKIDVDYLVVSKNNLLPVEEPAEADLQKWFNLHKANFKTKELRSINLISLSKEALRNEQAISDKEIEDYYKAHLSNYMVEEQRDYDLLEVKSEKLAQDIIKTIPQTINFASLQKADPTNLTLSHKTNLTKKDVPRALKDQIFSLSTGSYSTVIKDNNKFYIVHLLKITPKYTKPLQEEKTAIEKTLKDTKTETALADTRKKITAAIAAKKDLSAIAKENHLPISSYIVNDLGKVEGKQLDKLYQADWDKIARSVFHANIEAKPTQIPLTEGGYSWYKLISVTPARQQSFEEAKVEIIKAYKDVNTQAALDKRAEELKQELDNGASVSQLAEENNLPAKHIHGIDRSGEQHGSGDTNIPDSIYPTILAYGLDANFVQPGATPETRLIFKIVKIYQDRQAKTALTEDAINQMNAGLRNDILFAIELAANKEHPLKVNNGLIKQLLANM